MPVLPLVGSRIVAPGVSDPSFSAASTMAIAARSLIDPVGLWSSSLAHSRTSGVGDRCGSPTRGVPPRESTSEAKRAMRSAAGDGREDGDGVAVLDLGVEVTDERAERGTAALDGLVAAGVGAQDGRDPDLDGHGVRFSSVLRDVRGR